MQPLPPPPGAEAASSKNGQNNENRPTSSRPKLAPLAPSEGTEIQPAEDSRTVSTLTNTAKKRRHRGGKKRRNRRQSFAAPPSETSAIASNMDNVLGEESDQDAPPIRPGESFYRRKTNRSAESLESDGLLDHRHQTPMRPRRESKLNVLAAQRANLNPSFNRQRSHDNRNQPRHRTESRPDDDFDDDTNDRTPLMGRSPGLQSGYGMFRSTTRGSSKSSGLRKRTKSGNTVPSFPKYSDSPGYDVNNPPSVPGSPHMGASDPMMPDTGILPRSPESFRNVRSKLTGDALIDIDRQELMDGDPHSAPPSPRLGPEGLTRHKRANTFGPDTDVCFPSEVMSDLADDDFDRVGSRDEQTYTRHRRRRREWPQIWILDEWAREEAEHRAADRRRMQRVSEPVMVEGRLRSRPKAWHRDHDEDSAPMRYTYFNDEFDSTIHAASISELIAQGDGDSFRELFIPEPPLLEDSSSSESENDAAQMHSQPDGSRSTGMISPKGHEENGNPLSRLSTTSTTLPQRSHSQQPPQISSASSEPTVTGSHDTSKARSHNGSGDATPQQSSAPGKKEKPKKYGPRPTFWLDVMCPTDDEMGILQRAFGIHPLTKEDIMLQEAREKVELFKNYYFINYRTFEQDTESEDYLEPINVYVVVFQHGILTFHFSQIPHPANVRRRIRQLKDYLILSADWISYAMIDDITDAYVPMIHNIETEVDDIDEAILQSTPGAFSVNQDATGDEKTNARDNEKKDGDDKSSLFSFSLPFGKSDEKKDPSGYDMLRRVGGTRKKVMSLYRLLGTKADVIKGFAKRCNEQWDVAPKTEIGLYLGDIQDHILTMTSNLSHYETLLSRAHSNYLAQVSIRMNERSEQTSDVLNKLTVFGTIVLPMNIICGMWGMNVKVPGQDNDNLWWFGGITAFLLAFAVGCYLLCKKLYGIV